MSILWLWWMAIRRLAWCGLDTRTPGPRFTTAEIFLLEIIRSDQLASTGDSKLKHLGPLVSSANLWVRNEKNVKSRTENTFLWRSTAIESENLIHWMPQGTSQNEWSIYCSPHQILGQTEICTVNTHAIKEYLCMIPDYTIHFYFYCSGKVYLEILYSSPHRSPWALRHVS